MVEVTKADVAAAKKYGYSIWRDMKTHELIEGQTILECLASHRESTEQAMVDRIVAYLKGRWNPDNYGDDFPVSYAIAAIQRGDWE